MATVVKDYVFPDSPRRVFDLKGSSSGRTVLAGEKPSRTFSPFELPWEGGRPGKDGNFWHEAVYVTEAQKAALMPQFVKDIAFLRSHALMDYSLMLRVETMGVCEAREAIARRSPHDMQISSSLLEHDGFLLSVMSFYLTQGGGGRVPG